MASNASGGRKRKDGKNNVTIATTPGAGPPDLASDDPTSQQRRRDKKRIQNRLSQQSCREKQASYVRQLERFVENIQASGMGTASTGPSEDTQTYIQQLQARLWNSMKENQELRDAMLRMRKKMMSLGAAASAGADDVIFERVLFAPKSSADDYDNTSTGNTNATQIKWEEPETSATNASASKALRTLHAPAIPNNNNSDNNTNNINNHSNLLTPIPEDVQNLFAIDFATAPDSIHNHNQHLLPSPDDLVSDQMPILAAAMPVTPASMDGQMISFMSTSSVPGPLYHPPSAPLAITAPSGGSSSTQNHSMELVNSTILPPPPPLYPELIPPTIPVSTPSNSPFSGPFYPLPSPNYPQRRSIPDYHDAVVDTVERQVREAYEKMRFALFKDVWKTVGLPARKFSIEQVDEVDHMTLSDFCKTALRLMLKCSALEKYAYAMGTAPITEKILRWRLHPTPSNRASIPEPFHPTPLQHLVHNRPASIDFIHWGELRDQLILYKGNYDMRCMLKDTLDCLVREVAPLGIALPVMEYYMKMAEIGGDVVDVNAEGTVLRGEYDPNQPYQPCTEVTVEGAKRYGLHRLMERKLSGEFAKKYPFLDVTSISTKFPVIPWAEIGQYEPYLFEDPSINT